MAMDGDKRKILMSVAPEFSRSFQMHVSEGFSREINKLDISARLHAIELIVDSLKIQKEHSILADDVPHLTDLRGIGCGTWGTKEEIDEFIRQERESWDF
jgi:hypothetical protein